MSLTTPTVAVVTRTKNRSLLLRRALASVASQSFKDLHWVIVNDGGDPQSVTDILRAAPSWLLDRVRRVDNAVSIGMEAASNAGIKASASEFIAIHDDDDSWSPNFLEETVNALQNRPLPIFQGVFTHVTEVKERIEGEFVRELSRRAFNADLVNVQISRYLIENPTPPICFLYRRSIHDHIGYFDGTIAGVGDWDFYLRFLTHYEGMLIRKPLANYHIRETMDPYYGNSITAGVSLHAYYSQILWNRLLRQDLLTGRFGIGSLVALTQAMRGRSGLDTSSAEPPPALTSLLMMARFEGHRDVSIYGAAEAGRRLIAKAREFGITVRAVGDRRAPELVRVEGHDVLTPEQFVRQPWPIVVASTVRQGDILTSLETIARAEGVPLAQVYAAS